MTGEELQAVVIIPTFNNAKTLKGVLGDILSYSLPVIVVNDGSTDETAEILTGFPDIRVIDYERNRGKGFALNKGLKAATDAGYRYAVTLDSDGQHFACDIPAFLKAAEEYPDSLLIGARNLSSENMPGKNTFANKFSNFWFTLETGIRLSDTQSGFRLYPLHKLKGLRFFTTKYEFELEVIVQAAWRNIQVVNIPIKVYYPPEGERVSHFRPLRDFTRISLLNTVLVLVALLWYWPWKFINKYITHSKESNLRISLAVMFGVFMGIVPVWGYQMILAGVLAHFLGLNKVVTLVASNISIPPMIPFILFGSYAAGGWILNRPVSLAIHEVTFETIKDSLVQYLAGSMVFAVISGLVAGIICLTVLTLYRKPEPIIQ
jgi:glycosyltransferase involved in cell wall biosynthesis